MCLFKTAMGYLRWGKNILCFHFFARLVVFGIEIEQPSGTSVAMSDYEAFALWRSRARYDPSAIPNATLNATPWVAKLAKLCEVLRCSDPKKGRFKFKSKPKLESCSWSKRFMTTFFGTILVANCPSETFWNISGFTLPEQHGTPGI